jgi:hypothetical protein
MEQDLYLVVVSTTAAWAKEFFGRTDEPTDLGPADPRRYKEGAREWGFPRQPKNADERARVKWGVR